MRAATVFYLLFVPAFWANMESEEESGGRG